MNEFATAEASETEYTEVGETAVEGPVSVEFIGFEALPEIHAIPEAVALLEQQLMPSAELPQAELTVAPVATITAYLEAAQPLEIPTTQLRLIPPEGPVPTPTEPDGSTLPRPRRGTAAYDAHKWELAA
jgi:hypothetical protein